MACSLQRDANKKYDFTSPTGASVTVKVNTITPNVSAGFATAELNKKPIQVEDGDTITFTTAAGVNTLDLVVVVSDPNCVVQILEDCGSGNTQVLDKYPNDSSDPVVGYSILGS